MKRNPHKVAVLSPERRAALPAINDPSSISAESERLMRTVLETLGLEQRKAIAALDSPHAQLHVINRAAQYTLQEHPPEDFDAKYEDGVAHVLEILYGKHVREQERRTIPVPYSTPQRSLPVRQAWIPPQCRNKKRKVRESQLDAQSWLPVSWKFLKRLSKFQIEAREEIVHRAYVILFKNLQRDIAKGTLRRFNDALRTAVQQFMSEAPHIATERQRRRMRKLPRLIAAAGRAGDAARAADLIAELKDLRAQTAITVASLDASAAARVVMGDRSERGKWEELKQNDNDDEPCGRFSDPLQQLIRAEYERGIESAVSAAKLETIARSKAKDRARRDRYNVSRSAERAAARAAKRAAAGLPPECNDRFTGERTPSRAGCSTGQRTRRRARRVPSTAPWRMAVMSVRRGATAGEDNRPCSRP